MSLSMRACWVIAALALCTLDSATAQVRSAPVSDVRYDLTFDATTAQSHTIHVAMTFGTRGSDPVVLSHVTHSTHLRFLQDVVRRIVVDESAGEKAVRIREGILTGR